MVRLAGVVGGKIVKKVFQNRTGVDKRSGTGEEFLRSSVLKASIRNSVLSTLLISPMLAQALGLGPLTTSSSLNEPFDAKIELLNTSSEELQTLSVNLGGVEQFKNAGIERPFLLSSLEFVIVEDPAGNYLHITSEESIKEPFLNFLLEVNWAKGRLIREYTALLDPPVFDTNTRVVDTTDTAMTEPEALVSTEGQLQNIKIEQLPDATLVSDAEVKSGSVIESRPSSSATKTAPVKPKASLPSRVYEHDEPVVYQKSFQQRSQSFSSGASSYTTSKGDTLWAIAAQSRSDRSVSIQQMMLSLLNANPNAFANNNINVLKTGQILRIPDKSETAQISKSEAIAIVKEHNALWDDYRQGLASTVAMRPAGAASSSGTVVEEDVTEPEMVEESELRLVGSTEDVASTEEAVTGSGNTTEVAAKALENELALANEQLESGKDENTELRDQLRESEEIVELLKQQAELKNKELAALQQKLREADIANANLTDAQAQAEAQAAAEAEAQAVAEAQAAAEAAAEAEAQVVAEAQAVAEAEAQAVAEAEAQAAAEAEAQAAAEAEAQAAAQAAAEAEVQAAAEAEVQAAAEAEAQAAAEAEAQAAAKDSEGIDEILAELEGEDDSETTYLENDQSSLSNEPGTNYTEYDSPPENLTGLDTGTQYLDEGGPGGLESSFPVDPETGFDSEILDEDEVLADDDQEVEEPVEQGIFDKLLPAGLLDSIPGGIKTVLATVLGLIALVLVIVFKKGKRNIVEDGTETLDLLDPTEFEESDEIKESAETFAEEFADDIDEQDTLEVTMENAINDFDVEAENMDGDISDELPDLLDGTDDELATEGLVNLEDTLDQIKPLLEQTEEEGLEEDPLEEVNLSLAYEQFDKAESLVNKAIEENPNEDGYKLRLLEVHYAANNIDAYENAAKSLYEVTDGEGHLWESAVAMWAEMSPDRDLFEVVDLSEQATIPGSLEDKDDELVDPDTSKIIDISAEDTDGSPEEQEFLNVAETGESAEDFLNISETEADNTEPVLDITAQETESNLSRDIDNTDNGLEFAVDEGVEEDIGEDSPSIDMLDITAVGTGDALASMSVDSSDSDDEELFELTSEFKSVDESMLSDTTNELEKSGEVLEFSAEETSSNTEEELPLTIDIDDEAEITASADAELESLAKSLEDTISGLDAGGLDDLTFEFDPEGTLESTLTSTLGVSTDLDAENESDEIDTKINLAKAYIELGDSSGAKDILNEVSADGNDDQKKDAQELLQQIS